MSRDGGPSAPTVRELLFGVPMLAGELPGFDPDAAPAAPFPLFLAWLTQALDAGVREPHAMTLATVDADGCPDLRVVALRDATEAGWTFATQADSPKARQLAGQPQAAVLFHWREQARQIRVRGPVVRADAETTARDFLDRLPGSRAASLVGHQSEVLTDPSALPRAFEAALARVEAEPRTVDPLHALFTLTPRSVEFWQGVPGRGHIRLRYRAHRPDGPWLRERLWP
ncbi:pyridoxine/pyridoxamine 5'-phosphate oxidase [Streptacidiphilus anmyonensis]|uniref:pyridoxine/pyridoxamine 5'-phosphate oxidase n=1 Tax=Streptacidiphilus anmyonensis TaxID=405782 RepID=UPI0005A9B61F|nr:pyridoxal 5'-phosphate synthase [Streptacidiphilus anmyonensis]